MKLKEVTYYTTSAPKSDLPQPVILIPLTVQSPAVQSTGAVSLPSLSRQIASSKNLKAAKRDRMSAEKKKTANDVPRWRPILPKIRPKLTPTVVHRKPPHLKMDYCDCEFCNVISPSLSLRSAGVAPDNLPRPRPIRPSPYGLEFPTVIQQFNPVAPSSAVLSTIPAAVALGALPPTVPSTSGTVIHSDGDTMTTGSTSLSTTINNNGTNDKKIKHRTWYNDDTENETKSFRDFLKMAACEFKRSIEPSFDETVSKSKKEKDKTVLKAKRQKRLKTEAQLTRTDSVGDATSFDAPLSLGNDRFSPSSVSCASIDSGFADSVYPPSSPESDGTVPTSFSSAVSVIQPEEATSLFKRPLDENNNDVDIKEQIQTPEDKIENTVSLAPDNICFLEQDAKNDNNDNLETIPEPLAKIRRISDVFFNSQTSDFVNTLLKRSRQNSENPGTDEINDATIVASCSKRVRFATPNEQTAAAVPIIVTKAEKLCVSATISTRKATAMLSVDEKEITKLYLNAELQPIILMSEETVHDDIDRFNVASTSTASDISPAVSLSDETSQDSVDDPAMFECACQWEGCEKRFRTDNQLYDHVLGCHLEALRPAVKELQLVKPLIRQKTKSGRKAAETSLFCKWDQCTMCLKRGDPKKQFEWLIEHYTTRHAPRAQPFACLFGDCNLRFRTRRALNDHLLSAHDSEKPNGKRNSNINSSCPPEPISHCYNYSPLVRIPHLADMIDQRTMTWMRTQLALKNSMEPHAARRQTTPVYVPQLKASRAAMRKMHISSMKYLCVTDTESNGLKSQEPRHDVPQRKMSKDAKAGLLLELCRSPV